MPFATNRNPIPRNPVSTGGGWNWQSPYTPPPPTPQPPPPPPQPRPEPPPIKNPYGQKPAPWDTKTTNLPGNGSSPPPPYVSPPGPRGPGYPRSQIGPPPPTVNPRVVTPKPVGGGWGGPIIGGLGPSIPRVFTGDLGGAVVTFGGGAAGWVIGGTVVTGGALIAGVTAPAWLVTGGAIVGSYLVGDIAGKLWDNWTGDGTEGTTNPTTVYVAPVAGQPGKTSNAYRIKYYYSPMPSPPYSGSATLSGTVVSSIAGPVTVTFQTAFYSGDTRWQMVVTNSAGSTTYNLSGRVYRVGAPDWWTGLSPKIERVDGTSEANDIAAGTAPNKPEVPQVNVTQNITNGDTIININPAPQLGGNKTPTVIPPTKALIPGKPYTKRQILETKIFPNGDRLDIYDDGKGGILIGRADGGLIDATTPQAREFIEGWLKKVKGDSPNPPTPRPTTATPSADTTQAGTPTADLPDTGPAPTPQAGVTISGDLQPPAPQPPPAKPNLTTGKLPTGNKPPQPTQNPVISPKGATDTGPNISPVSQTGEKLTPKQTFFTNKEGELIGSVTDWVNPKGDVIKSVINPPVNTETINTVGNQIKEGELKTQKDFEKWVQDMNNLLTDTPTNVTTTPVPSTETQVNELIELQKKTDVDVISTLAIVGTLATTAALNQSTQTITTAIQNQPSPCSYPAYHPQNQAERAAISGKVDGVNTVLGTVTNVQIAEAKTGINNIIGAIGTPIAGGAQTVLGGIDAMQTWLGKFAKSLYLDKIYNGLTLMVSLHNAAMLSRNLAETIGFFIDSGLQALNLKKEDETPLDLGAQLNKTIQDFLKDLVGNDIYNGISTNWKKLSAIYTSAVNILDNVTQMLAGLAESMEIIGNYTGKIGNALKRGGVVLENAYNWMDDNLRLKTGKFAAIQKVVDGINNTEDVVNNLTEITEVINEGEQQVNEIKKEWADIKKNVSDNEAAKIQAEAAKTIASQGASISKPDLITPES